MKHQTYLSASWHDHAPLPGKAKSCELKPKFARRLLLALGTLALGAGSALAQVGQVQAILSFDGSLLTITGTPQDDVVDIRFSDAGGPGGPGGPGGDADILSGGTVIFHLTDAQRLALRECQVALYEGSDRFLVHDSPAMPFNQALVWNVDGSDGDDVIALSGPATGSTDAMVKQWQQLRPALEASGGALVAQAQAVMDQRLNWAQAQVNDLLRDKTTAVQARSLALIDRLVADAPDSLVSRAAEKIKAVNLQIAMEGPEALMARKGISEKGLPLAGGPNPAGDKGISEKGLPYFGTAPLFNADPVLQQIAQAEARMNGLFDWLPSSADDGSDAGLDRNSRFAQSLVFAHDIGLSLEALGQSAAADVAASCDPVVTDMVALSDYLASHSNALGAALEADATRNLAPLLAEVTDGTAGTDAFQTDMAVYQTYAEAIGDAAATECDAQILAIMSSLSALEGQLSAALESMDTPDAGLPPGSPAGRQPAPPTATLALPACSITTTNTITGGPGTDILFGTSANDNISGGGGADFIFGMGGDDVIAGDAGVDFLFGMKGGDDISGGDDTDFIFGDAIFWTGNDCLHGNAGIDVILGEKGDDGIEGGDDLDLLVGGAGNDIMLGDKGNDLMLGWTGDDSLDGGDDSDLMLGDYPLAPPGNDTLAGSGGTTITILGVNYEIGDFQFGNAGDDSITGGSGIDFQWGNAGDDTMNGDSNIDVMFGGDGADIMEGELGGTLFVVYGVPVRFGNLMFGGADKDQVTGGGDFDIIFGNGDDDQLFGGKNSSFHPLGIDSDLIFGNGGNDYVDGHNRPDLIFGNDGDDELHGDLNAWYQISSHDLIFGNQGNDKIFGGNGNDLCFGNQGDDSINGEWDPILDILFGNDGNDTVDGEGGDDLIFGNQGDDTLLGGNGLLDIIFGDDGNDTISGQGGIDLVFGGTGNDVIDGGGLSDILFGNDDDDTISGGDWPDLIFGNAGCDTIYGNDGFDIAFGNGGEDVIHGNAGVDFLFGEAGNDTLYGDSGIDTISGGDGDDTISGGDGFDLLFGNNGNDTIHGDNGPDIIFGNDGDDCLAGDDDPDMIFGGAGNDNIHGGSHLDTLFGQDGNDCIFGDNAVDLIWGGDGNDDIYGGSGSDAIWGGSGNDSIWSEDDSDMVLGGDGDDDINAGGATDVLIFGNDGADRMHGGDGNDWMFGNDGDDRMWGNDGNDKLFGNSGNDVLDGGNGNDYLAGGSGNDSLYGGPGTDILIGGPGSDTTSQGGSTPEDGQRQAACASICGKKWNDLNRNASWDGGEPGLAGVTIYLDLNGNGILDGGEPWVITQSDDPATCEDETGNYCFTGLLPGVYTVREVIPTGYIITYPANNTHQFYLSPGEKRDGVNFGNAHPQDCFFTVRGCKFLDQNGNGVRDPGEVLLPGVTIYHDLNNNGIKDPGEPSTVTGPDGCYALNFPYNGTVYITHICEVVPASMSPTFPQNGCREIDIFGCGEAPFRVDFGNRTLQGPVAPFGTVGLAYLDTNGDGIRQTTEPGLAGVTVWWDLNGNKMPDADEPASQTAADDPATPEDETGLISEPTLPPGTTASGVALLMALPAGHALGDPKDQPQAGKVRLPCCPPPPAQIIPAEGLIGSSDTGADHHQVALMPDADQDGYPDLFELRDGTNPLLADTDGDGLTDGNEARIGTNPLLADTDGDQLGDGAECDLGTDPTDPDTDDDGLSDGYEMALGSSPFHADSDLDGLSDALEAAPGGSLASWRDFDLDGLTDLRESALGTDPNNADSDGDGESDLAEVLGGTDPRLALDNSRTAQAQPRNGRIAEFGPQGDGTLRMLVLKQPSNHLLSLRSSGNLQQWTEESVAVPEGPSAVLVLPITQPRGFYQIGVPAAD
ncbi:MAG: hypothetical protein NTW21_05030 [Verrucomicrobia bacterium]|nr:hypothetical protein [Verrucomicrobiota bacterium]